MLLPREEAELVLTLHGALMQYVNDQLKVVDIPDSGAPYAALAPGQRRLVVKAFLSRLDLIDAFMAANPATLSQDELDIVSGWSHLVSGRFIALRQLRKHIILLRCNEAPMAYGVLGLIDPMESVIAQPLPAMIETVLLPFRGRIVYDGIIAGYDVMFGPGARSQFEEDFRAAKANNRLLTVLPEAPGGGPHGDHSPKPKPVRKPPSRFPEVRQVLTQLGSMTDAFCQAHLNEEYAVLCRQLAEKLAAKRPSPLLRGKLETWACGIIRTIGWVNFLGDRSQSPHLNLHVVDRAFGVAESTGQGKAKAIRQLLKIHHFDHRWIRPSQWENNPMIWLLQDSNGFMMDIRKQPLELQRAAFKQGLIPFVPADRQAAAVRTAMTPER